MSTVDAAVTALVTLFTTAAPSVQVIDGPPEAASLTSQQIVAVGEEDITGASEYDSMTVETTTEDYVVPVVVSVSIPGNSMSAARNAAIALYEVLKAAVVNDPTIGMGLGASANGFVSGEWSVQQRADENGRHVAVRWGVHVIATNT